MGGLTDEAEDYLERHIRGRRIIELGDAGRKINKNFFLGLGATSFKTADPQRLQVDGLTYLMRQQDDSAIVCSFGVLEYGVLHMGIEGIGKLCRKYVEELAKEIYRVTPQDTITFHGLDCGGADLRRAGFIEDQSAPKRFLDGQYDLTVLKKQKQNP